MIDMISNVLIAFNLVCTAGIILLLILIVMYANRPGGYKLVFRARSTHFDKTLITLELDDHLLNDFRAKAMLQGTSYKLAMIEGLYKRQCEVIASKLKYPNVLILTLS